ncbi:MAG: methionine--tRNA ligase [Chloroflexota bacterium]
MPDSRYYITTTIAYVNGKPHIGFALELAQTDVFARYHRLCGDDTYALTGTDENSLTNVLSAEKEGIPVRQLVDRNSQFFADLAKHLHFDCSQFIRTAADPRHAAGVQKLWKAVAAAGDLYTKQYSGLYCVRCERYYAEDELEDGLCPQHQIAPEQVEEENYFFRLSRYQDRLHKLISSDDLHIIPEFRKREVMRFIESGLEDFSVSRSRERAHGWGIEVPGDPSQVIYVWFDALANYITALDFADDGELYQRFWVNNPRRVHVLGKDVIRFHAVYWPAMLLSAGLPLPHTEFVHGFINLAGGKMSKTIGNVIDPEALIAHYGAEAVRYYLLRAISPTTDSNFSYEALDARYNADLANDLGNLLNRTVSMIGRYREGIVPEPGSNTDQEVRKLAEQIPQQLNQALTTYDPQHALDAVWTLVTRANKFVEDSAPWTLAKEARSGGEDAARSLDAALYTLAESVRIIAVSLEPLLPEAAGAMQRQLGIADSSASWPDRLQWGGLRSGTRVAKPNPLFPRLESPLPVGA